TARPRGTRRRSRAPTRPCARRDSSDPTRRGRPRRRRAHRRQPSSRLQRSPTRPSRWQDRRKERGHGRNVAGILPRPLAHCAPVWSRCRMEAPPARPGPAQGKGPRQAPRRLGILSLGVWLTARGLMVRASLALAGLGALGVLLAAATLRGTTGLESLPAIASQAFAWGAGTTLAVGGALRALPYDREQGVVALARARGIGAAAYAAGRVGGLVVVLALTVVGGTLLAGLAATAAVTGPVSAVARSSAAAVVFALFFAATIGPLAVATLGGRSRGGGYLG